MDYRDERDALRSRVDTLEQDLIDARGLGRPDTAARIASLEQNLAAAREHLDTLGRELDDLKRARPDATPRRSRAASGGARLGVILAVIGVLGAAGAAFLVRPASAPSAVPVIAVQVAPEATPIPVRRVEAPDLAPVGGYFRDASGVPGTLAAKIGNPVRVLELILYADYVVTEVQDPAKHANVDRYILRNGVVGDGEPVQVSGRFKTGEDVDARVADLASVDFGAVSGMIREAQAKLDIEDGAVSHAILRRNLPFDAGLRWRVYVSSKRKNGSVEFDAAGKLKKVWN